VSVARHAQPAPCVAPPPDRVGRRAAAALACELAGRTGHLGALILLAHPDDGSEIGRHVVGVPLPPVDGDALLGLVLPSEATVCDAGRIREMSLRRLARHWHADRLLVAPCTFGNLLVALAVVPIGLGVRGRLVEREARVITERFAAAVIGTRLFVNAAAS
jgi:hypothetical protein